MLGANVGSMSFCPLGQSWQGSQSVHLPTIAQKWHSTVRRGSTYRPPQSRYSLFQIKQVKRNPPIVSHICDLPWTCHQQLLTLISPLMEGFISLWPHLLCSTEYIPIYHFFFLLASWGTLFLWPPPQLCEGTPFFFFYNSPLHSPIKSRVSHFFCRLNDNHFK